MAWTLDLKEIDGTALENNAAFKSARLSWTADGAGAIEVELLPTQVSTNWEAGKHRIVAQLDGTPMWAGYLTRLTRDGPPGDLQYRASGLGLGWILDWRIVRHEFGLTDTGAAIVEALLDEAQAQWNGDMGFTMGTVTGTTATRTRGYCFGVVIGEAIRELASIGNGFDWEIDSTGALNVWQGTRGVASGQTLEQTEVQVWSVESETSDILTNVSAIGDPTAPWGPIHRHSYSPGLSTLYGRHEIPVDVDSDDEDDLFAAATGELTARAGARLRVSTSWVEGYGSWAFGDVWIQDRLTVNLPNIFGGNQTMRCIDISITMEPGVYEFVDHTFEALVVDATETDPG